MITVTTTKQINAIDSIYTDQGLNYFYNETKTSTYKLFGLIPIFKKSSNSIWKENPNFQSKINQVLVHDLKLRIKEAKELIEIDSKSSSIGYANRK